MVGRVVHKPALPEPNSVCKGLQVEGSKLQVEGRQRSRLASFNLQLGTTKICAKQRHF
jgi:hypothetical protein